MKIYKAYRDFSDPYMQSYEEYGYYFDKKKAIEKIRKVVREEQGERFDTKQLISLVGTGFYDVDYVGYYGVEEIEVI